MTELKNCCDQFSIAASIHLEEHNDTKIEGLQSIFEDLRSNVDEHYTRVNKRDILQWITDEYQWDAHYAHKKDLQEGMFDAILSSNEWQNGLLDDDGNARAPAIPWCHGPPGAGKST